MITLQLLVDSLILWMPFVGKEFGVWDVAAIGLIAIILRLVVGKLLTVKGMANSISFHLSLMTGGIPMIYYIYWHLREGFSYSTASIVMMLILCGIIWLLFWRIFNPVYYNKIPGTMMKLSFIPYHDNNPIMLVIEGLLQLAPMTYLVAYVWYGFAGHFSVKAIVLLALANLVWVAALFFLVASSRKAHPGAVFENRKDVFSDPVENPTDTRFEVKMNKSSHLLMTALKIAVLYGAFVVDGLYYDRIHNAGSRIFASTVGIALLVTVFAVIAAYYIEDRITLRLVINKGRIAVHRLFQDREVLSENDIDNYELTREGKEYTLYYDGSRDVRLDGMFDNVDKLKNYITSNTRVERYVAPSKEELKAAKEKEKAAKAEAKAVSRRIREDKKKQQA
ncbi:hypothetical protein [Butyrivibrio sp. MC2013]|uniref:hypothetical protein n=1 Tax=Butyrivibrio sp. MC2013 TaxID=1280686 RepID=UPI00047A91CA|nr:hypothetical protein [Butyrivibrio sp. MC2013]